MTTAAITGIGLITPAGIGRSSTWATTCAGRPTAARTAALDEAPVGFACTLPDTYDTNRLLGRRADRTMDRSTQLALVAAESALNDAGLTPALRQDARVAVIIGTAHGGTATIEHNHARLLDKGAGAINARFLPKGLVNMVSGHLSIELGVTGPNFVTSTACASGATAIGLGMTLLRANQVDIVITGGTDAAVTPLNVGGFHKLRALSTRGDDPKAASRPFDVDHDGFVMAEGAGILVLERPEDAAARRARPYAQLAGYGATADAHHPTAPHPDGAGAKEAIRAACDDAGLTPGDLSYINAHATSTPTGDAVEATVIGALAPDAAVSSTKGVTGHALGAAGAIEAAFAALAVRDQAAPPNANLENPIPEAKELNLITGGARSMPIPAALSNSFGFGGHNAALVFTQ
ncbi:beta-ketoacyl-[acyl-carrier-protein] synthase family protein [Saccharopolyspora sp. MS10]|uniref:beta-ketoacyl-[acyl-carrier-protein] synthase family protein n=1 Tax=Saccharopolyspora sp. MS10 TaxID=3385973 RepID=UPI0039A1C055